MIEFCQKIIVNKYVHSYPSLEKDIVVGLNSFINEREVFCAFQFDSLSHKQGGLLHFSLSHT